MSAALKVWPEKTFKFLSMLISGKYPAGFLMLVYLLEIDLFFPDLLKTYLLEIDLFFLTY